LEVEIRIARRKDLQKIARIVRDKIYDELPFKNVREWIRGLGWPPSPFVQWFVAEKENEIIGCMRWVVYDRYGNKIILMSSWIAVKEEYQGQEVGSILWQRSKRILEDYWQKKNCEIVMIFTQTEEENTRACNFYRKVLGNLKEVKMPKVWRDGNRIIWFFKEL